MERRRVNASIKRAGLQIRRLVSDDGSTRFICLSATEGRLMLGVMERRVGYFYFRDELGLDEATLGRLLAHHGAVLSQRRDTLAEKGASLRRHLNLDESELKKLIRVQPTLLGHNATQLRRKIEWLRTACDCAHERELGQACLKCPPLLATSARRVLARVQPNAVAASGPGAEQVLRGAALFRGPAVAGRIGRPAVAAPGRIGPAESARGGCVSAAAPSDFSSAVVGTPLLAVASTTSMWKRAERPASAHA